MFLKKRWLFSNRVNANLEKHSIHSKIKLTFLFLLISIKNINTWPDFVHNFSDEQPIPLFDSSKFILVVIFSKVNLRNKTNTLSEYFIRKIVHEMKISSDDAAMLSGDEFVISYSQAMHNCLLNCYRDIFFKVLVFGSVKLSKYNYFAME